MAFIASAALDARAAEVWRRHRLAAGFDAEALLDALGLGLLWEVLPDPPEGGSVWGALLAHERTVVLNEAHLQVLNENEGLRRFTIAHEVGHWLLHADAIRAGTVPMLSGGRTWCRGGSGDPERQAEMFAGRLLIPQDLLSDVLPGAGWQGWPPVYGLAETFAVTASAMLRRLEELNLAHRDVSGIPRSGRAGTPGQGVLFAD